MTDRQRMRKALRSLQMLDEAASLGQHHHYLIEAENQLGALLELECSGSAEGAGFYEHSGGTCPIHEWLVPADHARVERRSGARA